MRLNSIGAFATTSEIATALGVSPQYVRDLARSVGATGKTIGRGTLWPRKAVIAIRNEAEKRKMR